MHLLFISTLFLTSCALFSKKSDYGDQIYYYLADGQEEKQGSSSTSKIKEVLGKELTMAGGNYHVKIFPITKSLVKAHHREMSERSNLNKKQQEEFKIQLNNKLIENRTCLHFEYTVIKHEKAKHLNSWKLAYIDNDQQSYPISWNETPAFSMPALSKIRRGSNLVEQWIYEGTGCTNAKLPLQKGFAVKVTPAFVQWPFPGTQTIDWEFDQPIGKDKDGVEIMEKMKKKDKKSYQRYRGW